MEWFKKHKQFCITVVLLILLLPILLHFLIFENSFPSKVSNDGWADFFGGYIGALIGALVTFIAISIEIEHNKFEKRKDEIMSIRPYLYINNVSPVSNGVKTDVTLTIQNLGFQAACGITMLESDQDDTKNEIVYNKRFAIAANSETEIKVSLDLNKTERYIFDFNDIEDNFYSQEVEAVCKDYHGVKLPEHFVAFEPQLIQTKKEREEKFERIRIKFR